MGNGSSGLSKNSAGFERYKNYSNQVKQYGYALKRTKALGNILNDEHDESTHQSLIETHFNSLQRYRDAMDNPTGVDGTITYKPLQSIASANTNVSNAINVNTNLLILSDGDELIHEDTHNLVHSLITKELGFKKGSYEYFKAYADGAIERDIQMEAYKKYYAEEMKKPWSSNVDPGPQQVRAAVDRSGMRDYAVEQYAWAPKGTYIEVPTVAAECFHKVNYSWTELHKKYPYAYHVMRELYNRLHK